jgi:hypothetical protein
VSEAQAWLRGLGTSEGRSPDQLTAIKTTYKTLPKKELGAN